MLNETGVISLYLTIVYAIIIAETVETVDVSGIIDKIQENDDVVFDITEDQRGQKAINVKKA